MKSRRPNRPLFVPGHSRWTLSAHLQQMHLKSSMTATSEIPEKAVPAPANAQSRENGG
jgi:hypothetical protein